MIPSTRLVGPINLNVRFVINLMSLTDCLNGLRFQMNLIWKKIAINLLIITDSNFNIIIVYFNIVAIYFYIPTVFVGLRAMEVDLCFCCVIIDANFKMMIVAYSKYH